jgi:hypothetical protein
MSSHIKIKKEMDEQNRNIIIYQSQDGKAHLQVTLENQTMWLSANQMADLFGRDEKTIRKHINNVFADGELPQENNTHFLRVDGVKQPVAFYSLDMIISVGYRVNSSRATQFRIWATNVLKEYIVKGFAMDDDRLKELGGGNYWKELLDRIRDIRSSEKVMYRQVLDIYATAADYDPKSELSVQFFKIVQNKLHYATHQHTAAELIYERADAEQPFMGMQSFKGDWPKLADAKIAKNYLSSEELKILNNLVSGYFDFAEIQALRKKLVYMKDYINQLDAILSTTGEPLLEGAGKVSHDEAMQKATEEYRKWQNNTLSPIEQAYLETIKALNAEGKKNTK